ncbi:hypothetical protein L6452_20365 [Arctium lappa]|uniref:Uncharacterized protein n=1 Tax=Arctium lappa TaxID=4217 RepID=A0ACB9BB60_ARCLA|nr:hypothetical protein L6452_20365 [Arctium lappa]
MRIRKNANISAFLYTNSNHNHETNFCQLNQSPWDIITFPPSSPSSFHHHQVDCFDSDYNVNLDENWSSVDSIGAIQSNVHGNVDNTMKDYELYDDKEDDLGFMEGDEDMVLCGKPNGKGWECGKVVKNGDVMCEDHLFDLQNDAVWATGKKSPPVSRSTAGSRPRRAKKRVVAITSNPNEFYYYSGFGPSWGKKRGPVGNKCTTSNACDTVTANGGNVCETSGVDGDMGVEEVEKRVEPDTTMMKESWSCEVGPTKEDLDYMDEEEDVEKGKTVKKRGRKPIKARSLKSLM